MNITSEAFEHGSSIPVDYTCDGENVNPPLQFGDVPDEAKSLALIMDDPDAPTGLFTHWLVWNMAPDIGKIAERSTPATGLQGTNDFKESGYGGPCPPSGTHRYFFRLYALDQELDLAEGADRHALDAAMDGHVIDSAELMGIYGGDEESIEAIAKQDLNDYTDDRNTSDGQLIGF